MPGIDEWMAVAASAHADDIRERILTGFKDGKPFTPYLPTVAWPARTTRVLDFGCGLGRNFPYLRAVASEVVGFDLPPMIAKCREVESAAGVALCDDWNDVRGRRFDVIYASLVLQHLDTPLCRQYLRDFAGMAPLVYLLTRSDTDFGEHMFELVAESGAYVVDQCVAVDHDPDTHQLRVLGAIAFDEACRAPSGGHYEAWLKVGSVEGRDATLAGRGDA